MRSVPAVAFTLVVTLAATAPLAAQAREVTLGSPTGSHPYEFSLIRGIRELANGSILTAAPLDAALIRIDQPFRRADTLGRKGRGPGEYIQPDNIWPLAADSSLLVDLGNNRLMLVGPTGRLGNTMPIMGGEGGGAGPGGGVTVMIPGGVDRSGGIYFRGGPGGDSIALNRFDRATKQVTKVASLKAPEVKRTESGDANNRQQRMAPVPLSAADGWAVSNSGALFVVRSGNYRVEVYPRGAARRVGAPVPYTPVRIGEAERKEYAADQGRSGAINIGVENRNGEQTFTLNRGRPRSDDDGPDASVFPASKPPFDASQLFVDGKDRLWVRRYQPAGRAALYDVFNDQGALVSSVRLPASRIVVGMGATSVYVARINEDDLQLLERYALPL